MTGTPPRLRGLRVERLLGAGGTARVWQATTRSGKSVALKHLHHPAAGALPEAAALEALDALDHPNLIRLHEVRQWHGDPVLVLDLALGGTLAQLLARRRRLPFPEVIAAITPIASAVAALHAAGLVHGDISPGNVLFAGDGLPLLADLGSAYAADGMPRTVPGQGFADPITELGGVGGTTADVYGLAAVAFAALTGRPPCEPDSPADELRAADAPLDLVDLLVAGLDAEPSRRGTALEFALQLRWAAPMAGVDLDAGRHATRTPLAVLTRGRRIESDPAPTETEGRSRSLLRHRKPRGSRGTPPHRPSR